MKNFKRMLYLKFARKFNRNVEAVPVPTIISETTQINGDFICKGVIHIDGRVEGDISCDELVIGTKGSVFGNVTANNVHLYGLLQGKISTDKLFIAQSAKLIGDAVHNSIAIEPGAYIEGHCLRAGAPIPAEQGKPDLLITDATKKRK